MIALPDLTVAEMLAFSAAVTAAIMNISLRYAMKRGAGALPYSFWGSLLGGLAFLCLSPDIYLSHLDKGSLVLLFLSGFFWAFSVVLDTKSYTDIDVSLSALLDSLRFLCLVIAGAMLFGEAIGPLGVLGLLLILLSIFWGVPILRLRFVSGFWYKMTSVVFGVGALIVDKYLTTIVSADLVILSGFFTPAFLYFLVKPSLITTLVQECQKTQGVILLSIFFFGLTSYLLIHGFAEGDLWTTIVLYRSRIVFMFLLAAVLLKERDQLMKRGVASMLCFIGIVLTAFDNS